MFSKSSTKSYIEVQIQSTLQINEKLSLSMFQKVAQKALLKHKKLALEPPQQLIDAAFFFFLFSLLVAMLVFVVDFPFPFSFITTHSKPSGDLSIVFPWPWIMSKSWGNPKCYSTSTWRIPRV